MAIKLAPKLIRNSPLYISTDWVSNGHWIIKRSFLAHKDQVLVQYPEAATVVYGVEVGPHKDEQVQKSLDKYLKDLSTYRSTDWRYGNGMYYRTELTLDPSILLDFDYAQRLDLHTVYAQANDEALVFNRPEEPTVALMPMRGQVQVPAWAEEGMASG